MISQNQTSPFVKALDAHLPVKRGRVLLCLRPILDMASESIITLAPICFLSNSIMRPPPLNAVLPSDTCRLCLDLFSPIPVAFNRLFLSARTAYRRRTFILVNSVKCFKAHLEYNP